MIDVSMLNENQKEAVLAEEHYLRIVAGAGSGKTRVLTMRIAHLINDLNVAPRKILAITFTNKAANEMKERVRKMLEDEGGSSTIATVHSLCVRILREDINVLGYPRNFSIIDANDQKSVIKEAYKKYNLDQKEYPLPGMLGYISDKKCNHISVEEALSHADLFGDEANRAQVYEYYEKRLKDLYALDFDDLILYVVKIFKKYPEVKAKWQRRYHYIHVDEFQDIDKNQYQLIKDLAGSENDVYVVGDPDQTIYTWRGADVNIIMNLKHDFPSLRTIFLNQNYRSTDCILNGANSLIRNNKNRIEKELFTDRKTNELITHYASAGDTYEAAYVANTINSMHDEGKQYHDIAILYRSNYLSRAMEKALLDERIPYIIYGGTRFYERMEVKDCLSYLRMCTTADDLALRRIINTPKRGIGNKTIETIEQAANAYGCTMYEAIRDHELFKGTTQNKINEFVAMVENWRKLSEGEYELYKFFEQIIQESGYKKMLEDQKELDRVENIKELIDDVKQFSEDYPESTLDEYMQLVSLYGDRDETMESDFVQLMTVHAAKGLEFDTVFVIGMNDGIFPNERAMSEGSRGVEEERRLAYVAFTRAKNKLYITEAGGYSYIMQKERIKSRFIGEIDEQYIEHTGAVFEERERDYKFRRDEYRKDPSTFINNPELRFQQMKKAYLNDDEDEPKRVGIKKGDHVIHSKFGEGVVVSIEGPIAKIAFGAPYGVRKLVKNHPTLKRKQDIN